MSERELSYKKALRTKICVCVHYDDSSGASAPTGWHCSYVSGSTIISHQEGPGFDQQVE